MGESEVYHNIYKETLSLLRLPLVVSLFDLVSSINEGRKEEERKIEGLRRGEPFEVLQLT